MAKANYYAALSTAPQVQQADLATPIVSMLQRLDERLLRERKEREAEQKANEKFQLSNQIEFNKVMSDTGVQNFGIDSLDEAKALARTELKKGFEQLNLSFSKGEIDKMGLDKRTSALESSAKSLASLPKQVQSFMEMNERLEANNNSSAWNDLVVSTLDEMNNGIGIKTNTDGVASIYTFDKQGVPKSLPTSQFNSFFIARPKVNLEKDISDIVKISKPRVVKGEKNTYYKYLDKDGNLSKNQLEILTRKIENMDPRDLYDAGVSFGIIDTNPQMPKEEDNGLIKVFTDVSNENLITDKSLTEIRQRLLLESQSLMKNLYSESETYEPTKSGGSAGVNKSYSTFDPETNKFSYRRNSQTSFRMTSGFKAKDVIENNPSGEKSDVPPSSQVTNLRLTPYGIEVWGVQIKDKSTGKLLDFTRDINSLSDEEITQMGGNKVNFHKVIDPRDPGNASAIGELQSVFGFDPKELEKQLSLAPPTSINTETGEQETTFGPQVPNLLVPPSEQNKS